VYLRHRGAKLPRRSGGPAYQFDDEVRLEYYRLQKISEGSIGLQEGAARPLDGPAETGSGMVHPEEVPLSRLIDLVNERFGTDFNQADQLFFDQIVEAALGDDALRQAAAVNPGDKFELVFKGLLETLFVERMDQNEEIFARFMNDRAFQKVVTAWMASEAYQRLRALPGQGGEAPAQTVSEAAAGRQMRVVHPEPHERYVSCVPLLPLEVAAGAFGDPQHVEDGDSEWVAIETSHRLRPGMFVAQVVGTSMEPLIPDGAYCLFRGPVHGSRAGLTVLATHRDLRDPETLEAFTVKRYESEKTEQGEADWHHTLIRLRPLNRQFDPIVLTGAAADELRVIAEFLEVVG
jgi:hypothetical protein